MVVQSRKADRDAEVQEFVKEFYLAIVHRENRPDYKDLQLSHFGFLYLFDPKTTIYHLVAKDFQPNLEDILTECWRYLEDKKGLFPVVSYGKTPGWKVVEFDPLVFNS